MQLHLIIFQLSFRSVSSTVETKRDQVRRILQLPPPSSASTTTSPSDNDPSAAKEMEIAITAYLRRATETFDLSKNVEASGLLNCCTMRPLEVHNFDCSYQLAFLSNFPCSFTAITNVNLQLPKYFSRLTYAYLSSDTLHHSYFNFKVAYQYVFVCKMFSATINSRLGQEFVVLLFSEYCYHHIEIITVCIFQGSAK